MNILIQYINQGLLSLIIPIIVSLYCFQKTKHEKTSLIYYLTFVVSLPLTICLCSWLIKETNQKLSIGLNIYPLFVIFIILVHILTDLKLSSYKAYMLSFMNILLVDIVCSFYP